MSSLSVPEMRKKINSLYNGHFTRIFSMPENQVMAIYYQKLNSGAFDKKKQKKVNKGEVTGYYQMSIFDFIGKE